MPQDISPRPSTSRYADNTFSGEWTSGYLFGSIANALVEIIYGKYGSTQEKIEDKQLFANQTLNFQAPQGMHILSVAFKDAVAGTHATVSGYFSEGDQLGVVSALGAVSAGASLNFQHNGALVAAEPTIDIEDGGIVFTVADDLANTRVKVTGLGFQVIDKVGGGILPASPVDGQVVAVIPDKTNYPGVRWLVQWNASTAWWDVLGGSAMKISQTSGVSITVTSAWNNPWGGSQQILAPYQGDYDCSIFGRFNNVSGIIVEASTTVFSGAGQAEGRQSDSYLPVAEQQGYAFKARANAVAAGTALQPAWQVTGQPVSIDFPRFDILPIRIK